MTKKNNDGGFIYSTNPNFKIGLQQEGAAGSIPPNQQDLRIHLDRLGGSKVVTRIVGYIGSEEELEKMGRICNLAIGSGERSKF